MLFKKLKPKVFCIGQNKTGTTTLKTVLKEDFNYKIGSQVQAELLLDDWYKRNFKAIATYCKTAEAFQDVPFSLPYTYLFMDAYFKDAKFILSERDSADQWYNSLIKFHSKLWSDGETAPSAEQLKNASYRYKGYAYKFNRYMYNTPKNDPYNKEVLMQHYLDYNKEVKQYFKSRPDKLLVINVANPSDYQKLCRFLNQKSDKDGFPWKNKTKDLKNNSK